MYTEEMSSYYWPNQMAATLSSASSGDRGVTSSQYIMPFVRNNRDHRDRKKMKMYLNDSTHLNPSDPNTMRDQG